MSQPLQMNRESVASVTRTVQDILHAKEYPNQRYITEYTLAGSSDTPIIKIQNNPEGHFPDPPCSQYALQVVKKAMGHATYDMGAGVRDTVFKKGMIGLATVDTKTDYQVTSQFDIDVIYLQPEFFADVAIAITDDESYDLEQLFTFRMKHPFVEQIVERIMLEVEQGCPNGPLFTDHALWLLTAELLQTARQVGLSDRKIKPLSQDQIIHIDTILLDQLGEKITLEDIAGELGYTKFHLSKAFSATTGTTLYQYLMRRRLERALGMLSKTSESLANIAYDCGFASQSHMTAVFQKHVGITPGAYRKQKWC